MKKFTHAWISFKAIEYLTSLKGKLAGKHNEYLEGFLAFLSKYPSTFISGSWFPDTVIKDNLRGGHTWKYYPDDKGKAESKRPPEYHGGVQLVQGLLTTKASLDAKTSDLPDRCEALSQEIRDIILITNSLENGDVLSFNNSQVALLFLMLSHYVADAHMPLHCDKRDFYTPSLIHEDIEEYWEKEVFGSYGISKSREEFDLDEEGRLSIAKAAAYDKSVLKEADKLLSRTAVPEAKKNDWRAYLFHNNVWDCLVSICYVSFLQSRALLPDTLLENDLYKTLRIMEDRSLKKKIVEFTPYILSDAIKSVAYIWLSTWERWELLRKGKR